MKANRIMQSKIYRILDYVLRLVLLNALIVIPSFSLFIIFSNVFKNGNNQLLSLLLIPMLLWLIPSIVATTDVIRQYENNETNTIFKDFFKSLKKHYLKSLIISIFVYIGIGLLVNSLVYFFNNVAKGGLYFAGLLLTISFSLAFILIVIQFPLVTTYFKDLGVFEIIKLSCIFAFKNIMVNLLILVFIVGFIIVDILYYFVTALIGFSVPIYLTVKLLFKQYIKIYRKVERNEN